MCKTQKSDEQVNTHGDIEIIHSFKKAIGSVSADTQNVWYRIVSEKVVSSQP